MAKAQNDVLNGQYMKSTYDGFAGIFYILTKFTG